MRKGLRVSILPVAIAFGAFFMALPTGGAEATVHIVRAGSGWRFSPETKAVKAGGRVAFVNDTTVTHTATCDTCGWDTGDIQPGQTRFVTITSARAGTYHCRYHGQTGAMSGKIETG